MWYGTAEIPWLKKKNIWNFYFPKFAIFLCHASKTLFHPMKKNLHLLVFKNEKFYVIPDPIWHFLCKERIRSKTVEFSGQKELSGDMAVYFSSLPHLLNFYLEKKKSVQNKIRKKSGVTSINVKTCHFFDFLVCKICIIIIRYTDIKKSWLVSLLCCSYRSIYVML